jgi:hypothetical protein
VGQLAVARHRQQPAGQEAVVDVALEVAIEPLQSGGVEAHISRIDLGLQGPHAGHLG